LFDLTGLFEIFEDLFLTYKRLYIVSIKLLNSKKSFWFEEYIELFVGEPRITKRWHTEEETLYTLF